jgi:hypothetical protein
MAHEDTLPQVRRRAQFWSANKGGKKVTDYLRTIATNDPNEQIRKSAVFARSRLASDEAATRAPRISHQTLETVGVVM